MNRLARTIPAGRIGGAAALVAGILLLVSMVLPPPATAERTGEANRADRLEASKSRRAVATSRLMPYGQATGIARPACGEDCQILDTFDNLHEPPPTGAIATPIGTTYSAHHLVGADLNGDQITECFPIAADPPPGAPDDIVTFDGIPEDIRTDVVGTVPTVTESDTDQGDATRLLTIDTYSPPGTDLFPGGQTEPGGTGLLVDACFLIGIDHRLQWAGMDIVSAASISFLTDDQVVVGPLDVTGPPFFVEPWNGFFGITVLGGAGMGINGMHLEMLVVKIPSETLGACCVNEQCAGDTEEASCLTLDGHWHYGASCGANPALPQPICERTACSFDNGLPLDDRGAPPSQFSPEDSTVSAAADDFTLSDEGNDACRITALRSWVTHLTGDVDPSRDYLGVTVTIYADMAVKRPAGHPQEDGTHVADMSRGIIYTQTIPMSAISVTAQSTSCISDIWQLDIPVDLLLNEDTKYWLEVQSIMNSSLGQTYPLLSRNNNDHLAQQIFRDLIPNWQEIFGNTNSCPQEDPPTPPASTRRNLAFQLFGEPQSSPANDDCQDAILVEDGVIPFSTEGSTTDGPDEPGGCDFFGYSHVESDIWYHYVAACTGDLTIALCDSRYDTKLAVYSDCDNCPPRTGSLVACNEDACGGSMQSEVEFPVAEGDCYTIRIGGWLGQQGRGSLTVDCVPPAPIEGACCVDGDCVGTMVAGDCAVLGGDWYSERDCATFTCPVPAPPHDECIDCISLVTDVAYEGRTTGASGTDVSSCGDNDSIDVWHSWTADCGGVATFSLCGSSFDTTLAVYDACDGTELACVDDAVCTPQSELVLPVTTGETHYIRVSGYDGDYGDYILTVESCLYACCFGFEGGQCALGTPEQCASIGGTAILSGLPCLGDQDHNGIDDVCELPTWLWRDYNGHTPGGLMPDYDQNNDYNNNDGDGDPATGIDPFYCGPTAVANSLWWFHHEFPDVGVVPPHYTKFDLVEDLAARMGTNGTEGHASPNGHPGPYAGTFVDDMQSGIGGYLAEQELADVLYEHTVSLPPYELVVDELTRGQDVILLLGFHRVEGVDPVVDDFVVHWRRAGGHYVTVAGVDLPDGRIAISDPDADAAEEGAAGFVRGGDHDHDGDGDPDTTPTFRSPTYDHAKHSDKGLASHDVYDVGPFRPESDVWVLMVDGDPLVYGDAMALFHHTDAGGAFEAESTFLTADFLEQNSYTDPAVGQTYTVVEAAVIVSPFETHLMESIPAHEESLWRSENNIIRLIFDGDIAWPLPGSLTIREMYDCGVFGPDLTNGFTFAVENDINGDPRILRIREDGAMLTHRTWVAIEYTGGEPEIAPFELHYPVQVGDASNDGQVSNSDVSVINSGIPDFSAADDERRDINGDGRILSFDVSVTNGSIPSSPVPKPCPD